MYSTRGIMITMLLSTLKKKTGFVTLLKDNAKYNIIDQRVILEEIQSRVLSDESIEVDVQEAKVISKLKVE
ncbi:hypothetical protein [Flavobacterium sp. DSR3-2]|uniref:hypothetical protein n=1 Tax=Flavobacterium sp. DSR3-2 TaxID=2804634 RepID=UPI003CF09C34